MSALNLGLKTQLCERRKRGAGLGSISYRDAVGLYGVVGPSKGWKEHLPSGHPNDNIHSVLSMAQSHNPE